MAVIPSWAAVRLQSESEWSVALVAVESLLVRTPRRFLPILSDCQLRQTRSPADFLSQTRLQLQVGMSVMCHLAPGPHSAIIVAQGEEGRG